jgi:hypothetical protein
MRGGANFYGGRSMYELCGWTKLCSGRRMYELCGWTKLNCWRLV